MPAQCAPPWVCDHMRDRMRDRWSVHEKFSGPCKSGAIAMRAATEIRASGGGTSLAHRQDDGGPHDGFAFPMHHRRSRHPMKDRRQNDPDAITLLIEDHRADVVFTDTSGRCEDKRRLNANIHCIEDGIDVSRFSAMHAPGNTRAARPRLGHRGLPLSDVRNARTSLPSHAAAERAAGSIVPGCGCGACRRRNRCGHRARADAGCPDLSVEAATGGGWCVKTLPCRENHASDPATVTGSAPERVHSCVPSSLCPALSASVAADSGPGSAARCARRSNHCSSVSTRSASRVVPQATA